MSQIILDMGSGNTAKNDKAYIKRMYDELKAIDTGKHEVICKWQLFEKAGCNIPLLPEIFDYAYQYGTNLGYKVTSSVFDKNSLEFLLKYDVPFIKIANNRDLDWLIGEIPRKIPIYISSDEFYKYIEFEEEYNTMPLLCVSKYPAKIVEYLNILPEHYNLIDPLCLRRYNVSDHTTNFDLWYKYQPKIIEIHYKLKDSTGLDSGNFARTPQMLSEIL